MRKILPVIILGIFLLGLVVVPGTVAAQEEKMQECCEISNSFNLDITGNNVDETFVKGDIAGPSATTTACELGPITQSGKYWGMACMIDTIYTVTNWIFYVLILVAVIMLVLGGFTYIVAAGDPEKAGKGKKLLTYAIIGLAIALLAKVIPSVVKFIVGV